jgi:hypothetical protein
MSSFRTRLRHTAQGARGRQIGFSAGPQRAASPQLMVIAIVDEASEVAALRDAGATGFITTGLEGLAELVTAAGDLPLGVRRDATSVEDAVQAREAGVDFVAFDDEHSAAEAFLEPEPGRVLLLEGPASEERLRMIAAMQLDAIIVAPPPQPLTVRDQLQLRRIAELAGAPLIVPTGEAPAVASLHAWRNAGTLAVLVPGEAELVRATVEAARAVPLPKQPREQGGMALVPAVREGAGEFDDDDDF